MICVSESNNEFADEDPFKEPNKVANRYVLHSSAVGVFKLLG
jgi:hypothetical protein